jgi:hypothetical protein
VTNLNVSNILQGPCDVYVGAFGAVEPTPGTWTAVDQTVWRPAGATAGGVKLSVGMTFKELDVDQVPDPVGVRMTGRTIAVETSLSEITLANIQSLMNGGTTTTGGTSVGSSWTITASSSTLTSATSHGLSVGDAVVLGAITTTTGVTAGTVYYVLTVPSATTFTIGAAPGGSALSMTSNGSTASVTQLTYQSLEPLSSVAAFSPTYSALLLEGAAPGSNASFLRRVIIRRVLSTGGFEVEWKKDTQQGMTAKFGAYYISNSIMPFKIIDQLH